MHEHGEIRIGCPVWSCPHWRGTVYKAKSPRSNWLREYSQTFSTVEGNSTFYAIPTEDTFKRWADETADGFKFALKFPRVVSHEKQLLHCELETDLFLGGLDILNDEGKLGPSFIQLGPSFGPKKFPVLSDYLAQLPQSFPYAVEVRHLDWFKEPYESELNHLLQEHSVDRVIFDSRPLFSAPPSDDIEAVSQQRKPKSPIIQTVTGQRPIIRLVGRNNLDLIGPWIQEWTTIVQQWKSDGLDPFVFTHAPDDRFAPKFAAIFSRSIGQAASFSHKMNRSKNVFVQKTLF